MKTWNYITYSDRIMQHHSLIKQYKPLFSLIAVISAQCEDYWWKNPTWIKVWHCLCEETRTKHPSFHQTICLCVQFIYRVRMSQLDQLMWFLKTNTNYWHWRGNYLWLPGLLGGWINEAGGGREGILKQKHQRCKSLPLPAKTQQVGHEEESVETGKLQPQTYAF